MSIVYTYFRVPEPTGKTFAELDILFERGVSARKFKQTQVDAFEEKVNGGAIEEYERKLEQSGTAHAADSGFMSA